MAGYVIHRDTANSIAEKELLSGLQDSFFGIDSVFVHDVKSPPPPEGVLPKNYSKNDLLGLVFFGHKTMETLIISKVSA
jgi:hypothetical protein